VHAQVGAGTEGDYSALLRAQAPLGHGLGGSLALAAEDDGHIAAASGFRSHSLTGKIAPLDAAQAGRAIFRLSATESEAFPDSSGGPRLAKRRSIDTRKSREALVGAAQPVFHGETFRLDLSASYLTRRDETASPGVAGAPGNPSGIPAGRDDTRYTQAIAQALGRFDAGAWHAVTGLEAQRETARDTGVLNFGILVPNSFRGERNTASGFAELGHATPRWVVNVGARLDDIEDRGSHLTARAGVRYNVPDSGFALRASIGDGFKAPSFYALGNPFVGNRKLGPEKSRATEAGLLWSGAGGDTAALTIFHSRFEGLIDFIPGPPPRLENRNVVVSKGASLALSKALGDGLSGAIQVQYADTRDVDSGERLLNRPLWTMTSSVSWTPVERLTLTGRYGGVSARDDYAIPAGGVTLPGYATLSLDVAWAFAPNNSVRFALENALNDRHEDAVGFPAPGRRARLQLNRQF
jgi:outer membrane cobalamin receptor